MVPRLVPDAPTRKTSGYPRPVSWSATAPASQYSRPAAWVAALTGIDRLLEYAPTMLVTPCAFRSLTRAAASDSEVRSLVISSIGTPSTPPSALTRSRASCTPAYSCFARGACGPLKGKTAPTLTLAAPPPDGAVADAAQARTTPMAANCRSRTGNHSRGRSPRLLRDPLLRLATRTPPPQSLADSRQGHGHPNHQQKGGKYNGCDDPG